MNRETINKVTGKAEWFNSYFESIFSYVSTGSALLLPIRYFSSIMDQIIIDIIDAEGVVFPLRRRNAANTIGFLGFLGQVSQFSWTSVAKLLHSTSVIYLKFCWKRCWFHMI